MYCNTIRKKLTKTHSFKTHLKFPIKIPTLIICNNATKINNNLRLSLGFGVIIYLKFDSICAIC